MKCNAREKAFFLFSVKSKISGKTTEPPSQIFRLIESCREASGVLHSVYCITTRWLCSVRWRCIKRPSQARMESDLKAIKDPAHPHRCFQVFWLIKAEYRLKVGGAVLRVCWSHAGIKPFSQHGFWLLIVGKAQVSLITLLMTLFYPSVPISNDSEPAWTILGPWNWSS